MAFDVSLSGTTAMCCLVRGGDIHLAHVGDSRCVIGCTSETDKKIVSSFATIDHKASSSKEKKRIKAAGGRVCVFEGETEERLFLKDKVYPGMSTSRSIGDVLATRAGVTAEPEISTRKIDSTSRLCILATHGIWQFISSQEAIDVVTKYPPEQVQQAVEMLCQEAWKRWIDKDGNVVDDLTVIAFWLA